MAPKRRPRPTAWSTGTTVARASRTSTTTTARSRSYTMTSRKTTFSPASACHHDFSLARIPRTTPNSSPTLSTLDRTHSCCSPAPPTVQLHDHNARECKATHRDCGLSWSALPVCKQKLVHVSHGRELARSDCRLSWDHGVANGNVLRLVVRVRPPTSTSRHRRRDRQARQQDLVLRRARPTRSVSATSSRRRQPADPSWRARSSTTATSSTTSAPVRLSCAVIHLLVRRSAIGLQFVKINGLLEILQNYASAAAAGVLPPRARRHGPWPTGKDTYRRGPRR
jgi:hypothetical protein